MTLKPRLNILPLILRQLAPSLPVIKLLQPQNKWPMERSFFPLKNMVFDWGMERTNLPTIGQNFWENIKIIQDKLLEVYLHFERQRSFSGTLKIWMSKNMVTKNYKVEILLKSFSEHNPISLVYKTKSNYFRWRLNKMVQK